MLPADALARLLGGRLETAPGAGLDLTDLVSDSRLVTPGAGFIALRGERTDGHAFVAEAARRGARLAVVSDDLPLDGAAPPALIRVADTARALRGACARRIDELEATVVGVTGSVGKTTAKEMCALALAGRPTARTPGNLNTWTQIPLHVLRLEPPVERLVVEMAMTARGEIADLASFTRPRVGVLLNVGQAHIGLLGSEEAIAGAKAELLDALPPEGAAVLNADDPRVAAVAFRSRAEVLWFGAESHAARWRVEGVVEEGLKGTRAVLRAPGGSVALRLRVPGRHLLLDAAAAVAAASTFGVGAAEAAERISAFAAPEHRGRIVPGRRGSTLIDDSYNSSPTSLAPALQTLAQSGAQERLAIIGDMLELGERAPAAHREAGAGAARAATRLIAVGEQAATMADGAVAAGLPLERVERARDADEAAALAERHLGPATLVLVKGSHALHLETVIERLRADA